MIRKNKHAHCRRGVKYSRLILKLDPTYEIHFPQESLFSCCFFFWKLKKNIRRLISVLDPDPYSQNVKRKFVLIVAIRNCNPSPSQFVRHVSHQTREVQPFVRSSAMLIQC